MSEPRPLSERRSALQRSLLLAGGLARALDPGSAAAQSASSGAEPVAVQPSRSPESRLGLSGFAAGAYIRRTLWDIPIEGVDLALGIGPPDYARRTLQGYVVPSLMLGQTRAGLDVVRLALGGRVEWRFVEFINSGIALNAGAYRISRATHGSMDSAVVNATLLLGPELASEHFAAALAVTGSAEALVGSDNALMLGPGVELRVRMY